MVSPLAITGIGCLGSPGQGIPAQLAALRLGASRLERRAQAQLPMSGEMPFGVVKSSIPPDLYPNAAFALWAAEEALENTPDSMRQSMGLIVGTSTGGMGSSEQVYLNDSTNVTDPVYFNQQMHCVSRIVAQRLRINGPQSTHSVACVAAACALIEAINWLRAGIVERCLVIGSDANVRLTASGFSSLQLVDTSGCKPLCIERNGMNLGEGAAALLLETPQAARKRQAPILASLRGWGLCADGYHPTSPDPEAVYLRKAIEDSLQDAGIQPDELDWINAHGTGTRDNDATEAKAFQHCTPHVPVSSLKSLYGHTMGAAAAIEAVSCVLAIQHQERYKSVGAENGTPIDGLPLQLTHKSYPIRNVLSTSLAFGGMNASLVFGGPSSCL